MNNELRIKWKSLELGHSDISEEIRYVIELTDEELAFLLSLDASQWNNFKMTKFQENFIDDI